MLSSIEFKRDTSFRKQFFVPDSFAHPAKMDAQLLIWIVERYTEAGETILDPMAGSGTLMLACGLGRNVILVELEDKFCKMMRDNWEVVSIKPQLGYEMGLCAIKQGDARNLETLFAGLIPPERRLPQNIDKIVTSPPYSEGLGHQHRKYGRDIEASKSIQAPEYSRSPDNIGNLPYGNIDSIITSPPYEGSIDVPDSKQNARAERLRKAGYDPKKYQGGKGRNLQQDWSYHPVDSIITSPPYEGSEVCVTTNRGDQFDDKSIRTERRKQRVWQGYGQSTDNIGNLKSQFYLEAMLQVYSQCFKVLKPRGLMILVTKNFIRNKQIIRLDLDTIKLCEQAGFSFVERHYRKLSAQSFWRVIYHQKFPQVEQIEHEDILVFVV